MQSRANRPIRSKAELQQMNRGALKAFHGRDAISWRDNQRKAQSARKEAAFEAKIAQTLLDRSNEQCRNAIMAIGLHERRSGLVDMDAARGFYGDMDRVFMPSILDLKRDLAFLDRHVPNDFHEGFSPRVIEVRGDFDALLRTVLLRRVTERFQPIVFFDFGSRGDFEKDFRDSLVETVADDSNDDRYVLVDPDPEATRQYYKNHRFHYLHFPLSECF